MEKRGYRLRSPKSIMVFMRILIPRAGANWKSVKAKPKGVNRGDQSICRQ